MTFIQPKIIETPSRSNQRRAVRRVGDSAVIDLLHADLGEGRDTGDGSFDIGQEAIHIFLEQLELGFGRGAVDIAAGCANLIEAE